MMRTLPRTKVTLCFSSPFILLIPLQTPPKHPQKYQKLHPPTPVPSW